MGEKKTTSSDTDVVVEAVESVDVVLSREVEALQQVCGVLGGCEHDERVRIVHWVCDKFDIPMDSV